MCTQVAPITPSETARMTDEELAQAYESACAMSAGLYDQGADDSGSEAVADVLEAEMVTRGLI
jgi:hypothetical protein